MPSNFNHFPQISEQLQKAVSKVVRKTAFDIQAKAASAAPRDTSFLVNSIYVKTFQESTYGQAEPKKKGAYLLPEIAGPPDEWTAYAAIGANYGMFVEFGTKFMEARPYFYPAVEAMRGPFDAAISAIESRLS